MKKALITAIAIIAIFALVGCASNKKSIRMDAQEQVKEVAATDWWNNPPDDTKDYHYEVGVAKGTSVSISRNWAKADANRALAEYCHNSVEGVVSTYMDESGEVGKNANQALEAFEAASLQKSSAILTGVTYKYQTMADGTTYVLAALPLGQLQQELKEIVSETFVQNEAAAEAKDRMEAAIDKYFN